MTAPREALGSGAPAFPSVSLSPAASGEGEGTARSPLAAYLDVTA